jgi:hypothetical protein
MKRDRLKQILDAAGKLPPAKARALVSAIGAKADPDPSVEDRLSDAALLMQASMMEAALKTLEQTAP